jgi:hypothetical protein
MNIVRAVFIKGKAGFTLIAWFIICTGIQAIDRFGKDPCRGGFTNAPRPAEQISMSKMIVSDGIDQCRRNRGLPNNRCKGIGPVLARRNNILVHLKLLKFGSQI